MLQRQNDVSVKLMYTQTEFNPEVYQSQISRGCHNETAVLFSLRLPTHLLQCRSHPLHAHWVRPPCLQRWRLRALDLMSCCSWNAVKANSCLNAPLRSQTEPKSCRAIHQSDNLLLYLPPSRHGHIPSLGFN